VHIGFVCGPCWKTHEKDEQKASNVLDPEDTGELEHNWPYPKPPTAHYLNSLLGPPWEEVMARSLLTSLVARGFPWMNADFVHLRKIVVDEPWLEARAGGPTSRNGGS